MIGPTLCLQLFVLWFIAQLYEQKFTSDNFLLGTGIVENIHELEVNYPKEITVKKYKVVS